MAGNYVYETEDGNMENFVNSFSYMVYYSIDRYNFMILLKRQEFFYLHQRSPHLFPSYFG